MYVERVMLCIRNSVVDGNFAPPTDQTPESTKHVLGR